MILAFPNLDTLRLALAGGFVPAEVAATPAAYSSEPGGRVFLDTPAKLGRSVIDELKRLGATVEKRHPSDPTPVTCWPQVIPVHGHPTPLSTGSPVLFELPSHANFAEFVTEILRLGNDRQSFLFTPDGQSERALLRVIGPPYYTLLRATERAGSGVRAYLEQAQRVWVEFGHTHPLTGRLRVPEGEMLLVRAPNDWRFLTSGPFRDVYEALDFVLPAGLANWHDSPYPAKVAVPVRLAPGNATDVPELWVLRGEAAEHLDRFVRDADETLLGRLKFAVGTDPAGGRSVILRVIPSKLPPPVLPLGDAAGYKPYWKLPNLYVPAGSRLRPQLRRDAVRRLLADDPNRLVWLSPGPEGTFTPEAISEDSFRPLADWVEYVIDTNHVSLGEWVDSCRFAFGQFVCAESPSPSGPRSPERPGGPIAEAGRASKNDASSSLRGKRPPPETATSTAAQTPTPKPAAPKPPSEWAVRRQELEDRFLGQTAPLDAPERLALWPELARANAGAGDMTEAGVCWANSVWELPTPPADWLDEWLMGEWPGRPQHPTGELCDILLSQSEPTPCEARRFAVFVLSAAHRTPPPDWLVERLPAVRRHLESCEVRLPVRVSWLCWDRLTHLAGADVLGLARARDRLLQRLLDDGLNPERNLPHFLRFHGVKNSSRFRTLRDQLPEMCRLVRAWAERGLGKRSLLTQSDGGATLGYIDLLFAYAAARIGQESTARSLVNTAEGVLAAGTLGGASGIAAAALLRAFGFRIDEAVAGKPARGPLPDDFHELLSRFHSQSHGQVNNPNGLAHYAVSRFLEQSRVLEPHERLDPYRQFTAAHTGNVGKLLLELSGTRDPHLVRRRVRELLSPTGPAGPDDATRFAVLLDVLPLAARGGDDCAAEVLAAVPAVLAARTGPKRNVAAKDLGLFFERALTLAGHFDRRDYVGQLVERFARMAQEFTGGERHDLINVTATQSIRSLRRFGMADEIDRLMGQLREQVLGSQSPSQFRSKSAGKPDFPKALQSLLALAGGWMGYGQEGQALPILEDVRDFLLTGDSGKLPAKDYAAVTQSYVSAVGHGPVEFALPRLRELFERMDPARVTNGWTTAPCYSRLHLNVAEEVVLALVGDDSAGGMTGGRWLEEDEFLIRRRIHRDMKRALESGG